jgi:hypothetical protein
MFQNALLGSTNPPQRVMCRSVHPLPRGGTATHLLFKPNRDNRARHTTPNLAACSHCQPASFTLHVRSVAASRTEHPRSRYAPRAHSVLPRVARLMIKITAECDSAKSTAYACVVNYMERDVSRLGVLLVRPVVIFRDPQQRPVLCSQHKVRGTDQVFQSLIHNSNLCGAQAACSTEPLAASAARGLVADAPAGQFWTVRWEQGVHAVEPRRNPRKAD